MLCVISILGKKQYEQDPRAPQTHIQGHFDPFELNLMYGTIEAYPYALTINRYCSLAWQENVEMFTTGTGELFCIFTAAHCSHQKWVYTQICSVDSNIRLYLLYTEFR